MAGAGGILKEFGVKVSLMFDRAKAENAKKSIQGLGEQLKHVGISVGAASAALMGLMHITGEHAHEIENQSKQLGISTDKLQELEYASKVLAGVSRGELVSSLQGVSDKLFEARTGSTEAVKAFVQAGVSIQDLSDPAITADKVMERLADTFERMPDGMYKTGIAGNLGLSRMLPVLSKGSKGLAEMAKEGHRLGVIMDEASLKSGAKFQEQYERIWIVIKNISFTVGTILIKHLSKVVLFTQNWIVQNKKLLTSGIAMFFKSLASYLEIVFKVIGFVTDRIKALINFAGGFEKVSKYIAIAFGIFTAGKLIAGIGMAITAIKGIGAALALVNIQALAIAGAFMAVILIVQDLFSDDSIIKEWIGMLAKEFPNATKLLTGAFAAVKSVVLDAADGFKQMFGWIKDGIGWIGDLVVKLDKLTDFSKIVKGIGGAFGIMGGAIGTGAGFIGDKLAGAAATHEQNMGRATMTAPGGAAGGGGGNQYSANVTIHAAPGTDVKGVARAAQAGTKDGFGAMLRQTKAVGVGGDAY